MKESKKVFEFKVFFGDYKIDIERELKGFASFKVNDLDLFHRVYDRISRELKKSEAELKGALIFLNVMGYIDDDSRYNLNCDIVDYFSEQTRLLFDLEGRLFDDYVRRIESETA